jgi:hypothetical protein
MVYDHAANHRGLYLSRKKLQLFREKKLQPRKKTLAFSSASGNFSSCPTPTPCLSYPPLRQFILAVAFWVAAPRGRPLYAMPSASPIRAPIGGTLGWSKRLRRRNLKSSGDKRNLLAFTGRGPAAPRKPLKINDLRLVKKKIVKKKEKNSCVFAAMW